MLPLRASAGATNLQKWPTVGNLYCLRFRAEQLCCLPSQLLSSILRGPRAICQLRNGGQRGAETTADRRVRPGGAYREQCKAHG
jgi:hypothetical protein